MDPHVAGSILRLPMLVAWARLWQWLATRVTAGGAAWRDLWRALAMRWHAREEWEIRRQEETYIRAIDHHHLERLEREWDRHDANVMPGWEWR